MEYMTGYNNGYVPPRGSAGSAAFGNYSSKSNPMSVPRKGSSIGTTSEFSNNADHNKVQSLKGQQAVRENLRGYSC